MDFFTFLFIMAEIGIFILFCFFMYWMSKIPEPENPKDKKMICPHCQTRGSVSTTKDRSKASLGDSMMTGGLSLIVDYTLEAKCSNCGAKWTIK